MSRRLPKYLRIALRVLAPALVAWGGWSLWKQWLKPWLFPPSPLAVTPVAALEALGAKSLYYNGAARPWLVKLRPELLTAEDRDEASARSRAFPQATQSPRLFRQLDRQFRFDTVLLVDDPSHYQRLLNHFIELEPEKREFKLVYLDHWALVFKRGAAREWQPEDAEPVRKKMAGLRAEDRAYFLAKAAAKMLAVSQPEPARRWLEEALAADGSSVDALAGMASYYVTIGRWVEAESFANKALEQNENYIHALQAKVVALRSMDRRIEALKFSEKLNGLLPDEPVRLQYHARIAHEARAYEKEIAALTKLIAMAKEELRPTGDYEFQLGEAHALMAESDDSHVPLALACYKAALLDPALPPAQRKFAEERMVTIREKTGLK
jgi:tetratricopeptide (TPR) repeat protein